MEVLKDMNFVLEEVFDDILVWILMLFIENRYYSVY